MADNLLIFGVRPVIEAIEAGKQFDRIYIKRGADSPVMEQLKGLCRERKVAFQEVPIEKLNRLTRGNHQGVVAQTSSGKCKSNGKTASVCGSGWCDGCP